MSKEMTMNSSELLELAKMEEVISTGIDKYVEVGLALANVSAKRLYRATHNTFESYCRDRWKMSDVHAYRLMLASRTALEVSTNGRSIPPNESQAFTLGKVPAEAQKIVWDAVASTGKPSGGKIQSLLDKIRQSPLAPIDAARKAVQEEKVNRSRSGEVAQKSVKDGEQWHVGKVAFHVEQAMRHVRNTSLDNGDEVAARLRSILDMIEATGGWGR